MRSQLLGFRNQKNDLVIDVGSLDGSDAILFAQATKLRVWTFEPSPSKHAGIREKLARAAVTDTVTLYPFAISNRTGEATLELLRASGAKARRFMGNGFGSSGDLLTQVERPVGLPPGNATELVRVPVRRLDDLVNISERIAFLKVDAQGQDLLVLRGAERLLANQRVGTLKIEFSPFLMPGRTTGALAGLRWLEQLGYRCAPCHASRAIFVDRSKPMSVDAFVGVYRGSQTAYDDIVCRTCCACTSTAKARRGKEKGQHSGMLSCCKCDQGGS